MASSRGLGLHRASSHRGARARRSRDRRRAADRQLHHAPHERRREDARRGRGAPRRRLPPRRRHVLRRRRRREGRAAGGRRRVLHSRLFNSLQGERRGGFSRLCLRASCTSAPASELQKESGDHPAPLEIASARRRSRTSRRSRRSKRKGISVLCFECGLVELTKDAGPASASCGAHRRRCCHCALSFPPPSHLRVSPIALRLRTTPDLLERRKPRMALTAVARTFQLPSQKRQQRKKTNLLNELNEAENEVKIAQC